MSEEDLPAANELFATETMAELYARQGRTADAVGIYRRLLGGEVEAERRARWTARVATLEGAALARAAPPSGVPRKRDDRAEAAAPVGPGPRPALEPGPAIRPALHRPPLLVESQVRSGQIIYAEDRDLVVLAPVNPGAQLLADGHIHVYAALRGRAIAGAHGWLSARIFCQRLEAELVGVDAAYVAFEDLPRERFGKPAQVTLREGRCFISAL